VASAAGCAGGGWCSTGSNKLKLPRPLTAPGRVDSTRGRVPARPAPVRAPLPSWASWSTRPQRSNDFADLRTRAGPAPRVGLGNFDRPLCVERAALRHAAAVYPVPGSPHTRPAACPAGPRRCWATFPSIPTRRRACLFTCVIRHNSAWQFQNEQSRCTHPPAPVLWCHSALTPAGAESRRHFPPWAPQLTSASTPITNMPRVLARRAATSETSLSLWSRRPRLANPSAAGRLADQASSARGVAVTSLQPNTAAAIAGVMRGFGPGLARSTSRRLRRRGLGATKRPYQLTMAATWLRRH